MINKPDLDLAATRAMEILLEHRITETPINPLPILLNFSHVRVMPYTRMASEAGIDRRDLIPLFGNQDATTFHLDMPGMDDVKYVVVYNMRLPFDIVWRAVARELGHIVLGHDGMTRTMDARMAEARCFAHHLICPRPVIRHLQEAGLPLSLAVLANTTGCSDECVEEMQAIPAVHVSPDLNRSVRELFAPHLDEFISFHNSAPRHDHSPLISLGTYMDGYDESTSDHEDHGSFREINGQWYYSP